MTLSASTKSHKHTGSTYNYKALVLALQGYKEETPDLVLWELTICWQAETHNNEWHKANHEK